MDEPIIVIGHRNPDADAICSAIGYAAYKEATGSSNVIPARCGNSNARIDSILRRFDVPLPTFVGDVTPRVRDIMVRDIKKAQLDTICAEALQLFDRFDFRVLPVVNENNGIEGCLSIFDLGDYFIPKPSREKSMRRVHTTISDIVRALNADVIHAVDPDRSEELYVRIAAMDIRSFGRFYFEDEDRARTSVIVVGDRYDIQQKSIQAGVRLLVITGGLPVEPDVVQMAKERNVCLIISPDDSATTSLLIRSATRVERLMRREFVSFGPDEKIATVRRRLANVDSTAFMVLDEDEHLIGLFTKTDLLKSIEKKIILVDHNEITHAVEGADQANILEIVDHHRLGNPNTEQPILFLNAPVGSTSTIVASLFSKSGHKPDQKIAGILMAGIISDTLNTKGPTTTEDDRQMLAWLQEIAGVSIQELADLIFQSGSVILESSPQEVIRGDMKTYHEHGVQFSVSQVEELGFDNFLQKRQELEDALEEIRLKEDLFFSALLVTDINRQNSLLLIRGSDDFIDLVKYPTLDTRDLFELNGIVSRKKQVIPYISGLLRNAGLEANV